MPPKHVFRLHWCLLLMRIEGIERPDTYLDRIAVLVGFIWKLVFMTISILAIKGKRTNIPIAFLFFLFFCLVMVNGLTCCMPFCGHN